MAVIQKKKLTNAKNMYGNNNIFMTDAMGNTQVAVPQKTNLATNVNANANTNNVDLSTQNNLNTTNTNTNSSTNTNASSINPITNAYQRYKEQLELSKANAKVDIANANTKANQYLNNYLRMQGIQNSGLGASAIGQLNTNAINAMSKQDVEYDKALNDYREQYNQNIINNADVLMGKDRTSAQKYIDSIKGQEGVNQDTVDYLQGLANKSYYSLNDDIQKGLDTLAENIYTKNETGEWSKDKVNSAVDAYGELQNIKSEEELQKWTEKYKDLISTSPTYNISKDMLSTREKEELNKAGVTDFNAIDLDKTNKEDIRKWLGANFKFGRMWQLEKQIEDIANAKEGSTITINHLGKNTKLYYKNGKLYIKQRGDWKND